MTVPMTELLRVFGRIGILSFGGPAAQIALMHRELVDNKGWISDREYLSALSFCMLLPGPEAMQLATWAGWRLRGTAGGLVAGLLFVVPGAAVVLALAMAYAAWGDLPLVAALFVGVKAVVVVVVIEALLRVARRALKGSGHWAIAVLAFLGLFLFDLPFPLIVMIAGAWGLLRAHGVGIAVPSVKQATPGQTLRTVTIWAAVWLLPLAGLIAHGGILADIGVFFSLLAVVTFGGAYAVLAWMTQAVVTDLGWLTLPQMIDGLGLAETTPGPLILVTEFVAYLAAYGVGGVGLGVAGALVALWVTFVPCFLWIFAAAPWLDRITANPRLAGALAAITAAVVGIIANLSVWFAAHAVFGTVNLAHLGPISVISPELNSLNLLAVMIALVAGWLVLVRHWPFPLVLVLAAGTSATAMLL
ncbi:MAG: chromate efflux transporter [Gemmobacter sp.]|nr:chromate efflux transporter [Gemmobacter sp.]